MNALGLGVPEGSELLSCPGETGTKTLVIAGQVVAVSVAKWWFKATPTQGGPSEWMVLNVGEHEFSIQFGSNVDLDEEKGQRALDALEAIASSFRLE